MLPEIQQPPRILSAYMQALQANNFKNDVDQYLRTREVPILMDMHKKLLLPTQAEAHAAGTKYNVPVINSLVLYVGVQAIQQMHNKMSGAMPITHSAQMDIFQQLVVDLDTEGRYLFLNAIANQLRYPNNHTHYFSRVLLYLFSEANQVCLSRWMMPSTGGSGLLCAR